MATLINVESTSSNISVTIHAIALDSADDVCFVGSQYDASGNEVAFVARCTTAGVIQWQRRITDAYTTPNDISYGVAVDGSNNVYVTGLQRNSAGNQPAFLAKYNTSGVIQWQRSLTDIYTTPSDIGRSVAVDSSANVYITGAQLNSAGNGVAFLAKYNTSGVIQWQRSLTDIYTTPGDIGYGIAVDSSANVYVAGQQRNSYGDYPAFLAKYDTTGAIQWQRSLTDTYTYPVDYGNAVAVDSSANVYVTGQQRNSAGTVAFVAKYNTSGVIQWQRSLTDAYISPTVIGRGIAVDGSGNVYVTGQQDDSGGNTVGFVVMYNTSGAIQWQRTLTDTDPTPFTPAFALALDGNGNFYAAGEQHDPNGKVISFVLVAPTDGSQTGTFTTTLGAMIYGAGTLTDAAGTLTDAADNLTDSLDNLITAVSSVLLKIVMVI